MESFVTRAENHDFLITLAMSVGARACACIYRVIMFP